MTLQITRKTTKGLKRQIENKNKAKKKLASIKRKKRTYLYLTNQKTLEIIESQY